jgi:hypothetical protein
MNAQYLARAATRNIPLAQPWFRAKAPARRTIATAGTEIVIKSKAPIIVEPNHHFTMSCPIQISQYPQVLMAHGGGGRLMHQLLEAVFARTFSNPILDARHDSAQFTVPGKKLAMTTDSYVVRPLFFPGGDIGYGSPWHGE